MSMEFLTWPWMHLFFSEDEGKYKYAHLSGAILFIPYGAAVDEFQHWVHEHPEPRRRSGNGPGGRLKKNTCPTGIMKETTSCSGGGYWFRQGHIFTSPFYYIDYTLAQVCALQSLGEGNTSRDEAWQDYLRLCRAGGSKPFLELVTLANLKNPFAGLAP